MTERRLGGFIIDCKTDDLQSAAEFWSEALGYPTKPPTGADEGKYVSLDTPPGEPYLEVQKVDHSSRVHLDIQADNIAEEVRRLQNLGAKKVDAIRSWVVMEAPTGQRFCVVPTERLAKMLKFGRKYAEAWSSRNPSRVAEHFAVEGSLTINDEKPCVGREALTELARSFMTELPDMVLSMDELHASGEGYVYRWTLRGTSTGPGGTGHPVDISGYEEWIMSRDGLVLESRGHMDLEDYRRQLEGEAGGAS